VNFEAAKMFFLLPYLEEFVIGGNDRHLLAFLQRPLDRIGIVDESRRWVLDSERGHASDKTTAGVAGSIYNRCSDYDRFESHRPTLIQVIFRKQ
jgi:hypothetical protein